MNPDYSRDRIIARWYNSKELAQALAKMEPAQLRDDLKQEMFVALCSQPADKLAEMDRQGYIGWWLFRTMKNMIQSNRSTFYNTFRKFGEEFAPSNRHICIDGSLSKGEMRIGANVSDFTESPKDFETWIPPALIHYDDSEDNELLITKLPAALEQLDPYEAGMFRLYVEMGNSCKPVAKATKIQERSVRFAVAQARRKLQTDLRRC